MKRIKLCVVGAGKIFEKFHLPAINATEMFEIVGVIDKNRARLVEINNSFNLPTFGAIDEIKRADLCFVATPPNVRKQVILPAIAKGMNIVCEKPFTYTSEDAKFLIGEADKQNKKIFVTQTRRLFTNILILKNMFESGYINNIKNVKIIEGGLYGWESVGTERAEIFDKDYGVLNDVGAHILDIITFIFTPQNIDVKNSIFDYDLASNNVSTKLRVTTIDNKIIPITVKISRDQNLFNYLEIETDRNVIRTRSLFDKSVKLIGNDNQEFVMQSTSYPKSMEEVFSAIWEQIYNEINNKNNMGFSLNAKTVLNSIELIEKVAEKKNVIEFDDYYQNEVWNGNN